MLFLPVLPLQGFVELYIVSGSQLLWDISVHDSAALIPSLLTVTYHLYLMVF